VCFAVAAAAAAAVAGHHCRLLCRLVTTITTMAVDLDIGGSTCHDNGDLFSTTNTTIGWTEAACVPGRFALSVTTPVALGLFIHHLPRTTRTIGQLVIFPYWFGVCVIKLWRRRRRR
jgi:hypothetical protein